MAANTVLRLDSTTKTFAVDKAPPYAYTINYSDGSSADHQVRFFTPLLSSGGQHYTHNTITMSADFEIEIDYKLANLTTDNALIGDTDALSGDIWRINGNINSMLIRLGGSTYTTTGSYTEDLKLNTAKMTRVGTTVKIFRNNIEIYSGTISLVDFTIDMVGTRQNGAFDTFNGILANYKVTNIASLVMDAPIDRQYTAAAPTVINKADATKPLTAINLNNAGSLFTDSDTYGWISGNILSSPTSLSADVWTDNGNGSYTISQPDNAGFKSLQFTASVVDYKYLLEYDNTDSTNVNNSVEIFQNGYITPATAGSNAVLVTAQMDRAPYFIAAENSAFTQTISNLTYKQILEIAQ